MLLYRTVKMSDISLSFWQAFNLIWMFDKLEFERLFEDLQSLKLRPPVVGHTFPFSKAVDALRTFQTGKTTGKVVLVLD